MNNYEISELLRNIAASYEITGENSFRIHAYNQASNSIKLLPVQVKDMWKEGKLKDIPGIGGSISGYLEELFKTGSCKHFISVFSKIPKGTFELMKIRTIGPKTASKIALEITKSHCKGKNIYIKLKQIIEKGNLEKLPGIGEKRVNEISMALNEFLKGQRKKKRMLLSEAIMIAQQICSYLKKDSNVINIDVLGSLRRHKETIGDIDIAVVSSNPTSTIEHFILYPDGKKVIDKGDKGATIITNSNVQIDLRLATKNTYGTMLQYFTGNKYHNIKLREYAIKKGFSISEYGIRQISNSYNKRITFESENSLYNFLGLSYIPPELREDKGEIEQAHLHTLPDLINESDIKGDLHIHSDYNISSSHDIGISSLDKLLNNAQKRNYEYIGISDHNPKISGLTSSEIVKILKERKKYIEHFIYSKYYAQKYSSIKKVFILLEVDIRANGDLALPDKGFDYVEAILISIHSSFNLNKDQMTNRIIRALKHHSKVRILAHPTGRLINERSGIEAYWDEIVAVCNERKIALEINANPNRLDFPDNLIWNVRSTGSKFVIGTDAHQEESIDDMKYGVSQARRGWLTKHDILNTLPFGHFSKWLKGEEVNIK